MKRDLNKVDVEKKHESKWQETLFRRMTADFAASYVPQSITGIFCSLLSRLTLVNTALKISRDLQDVKYVFILYMSFQTSQEPL